MIKSKQHTFSQTKVNIQSTNYVNLFLIMLPELDEKEEEEALATLGAGQDALQTLCQIPKGDNCCLQVELAAVATADDRC